MLFNISNSKDTASNKRLLCVGSSLKCVRPGVLEKALSATADWLLASPTCRLSWISSAIPVHASELMLTKCGVGVRVSHLTYVDSLTEALHEQQDEHVKRNKVDDEHVTTPSWNLRKKEQISYFHFDLNSSKAAPLTSWM